VALACSRANFAPAIGLVQMAADADGRRSMVTWHPPRLRGRHRTRRCPGLLQHARALLAGQVWEETPKDPIALLL
jgi:hypothetical protein